MSGVTQFYGDMLVDLDLVMFFDEIKPSYEISIRKIIH